MPILKKLFRVLQGSTAINIKRYSLQEYFEIYDIVHEYRIQLVQDKDLLRFHVSLDSFISTLIDIRANNWSKFSDSYERAIKKELNRKIPVPDELYVGPHIAFHRGTLVLYAPLGKMPLYINSKSQALKDIISWRLRKGK